MHFLQCHSKNNSPSDLKTQLWACAFEPAWDEGIPFGGRGPGNATFRGYLGGWGAGRDRELKASSRSGGATAVDN